MGTRFLYIDDSGKPDAAHASHAVVLGGVSVDSSSVRRMRQMVNGAKRRYYPGRGKPDGWELKAATFVKPNPWKRANNRSFVAELESILRRCDATVFTATITKARMVHPLALTTTMPLQLQCLLQHFAVECAIRGDEGVIASDWSAHFLDAHASKCVGSFAAARGLPVHPFVYYANSAGCEAIQVADVISGTIGESSRAMLTSGWPSHLHEQGGDEHDGDLTRCRTTLGPRTPVVGRPVIDRIDCYRSYAVGDR